MYLTWSSAKCWTFCKGFNNLKMPRHWRADPSRTWKSFIYEKPSQWRHNERNGVSNHRHLHCLLNCWFRRRSKKMSKLCVTGLCAGNSTVTGEFPAQRVSNAENKNVSIDDFIMLWEVRLQNGANENQELPDLTNPTMHLFCMVNCWIWDRCIVRFENFI